MQKEILRKIHIRLSKVILLRDAFSEEIVTNGIQVRVVPSGKRPVMKPGGYWLFLDMGQEEFEIEIESAVYQRRRVRLKPDQGEETEELFLSPSGAYPVRAGQTMLRGTAVPGTLLRFHLEEGIPEGRLIYDCREGDQEISIFMRGTSGARRKWYVRDKEGQDGEYIQLRESPGEAQKCCLFAPLRRNYRKKDTSVYQAYECTADDDGQFFLLLDHLKEQNYRLYYSYMEDGKEFHGETEIEFGDKKEIRI